MPARAVVNRAIFKRRRVAMQWKWNVVLPSGEHVLVDDRMLVPVSKEAIAAMDRHTGHPVPCEEAVSTCRTGRRSGEIAEIACQHFAAGRAPWETGHADQTRLAGRV
jgi:hypothetical protein